VFHLLLVATYVYVSGLAAFPHINKFSSLLHSASLHLISITVLFGYRFAFLRRAGMGVGMGRNVMGMGWGGDR